MKIKSHSLLLITVERVRRKKNVYTSKNQIFQELHVLNEIPVLNVEYDTYIRRNTATSDVTQNPAVNWSIYCGLKLNRVNDR